MIIVYHILMALLKLRTQMTIIETLGRILYLSNLDYCESSGDMQDRLEEINKLIQEKFPTLEEIEN